MENPASSVLLRNYNKLESEESVSRNIIGPCKKEKKDDRGNGMIYRSLFTRTFSHQLSLEI